MNYMTSQEAAEKWGISLRRVQVFCVEGRIPGAQQIGRQWMIPVNALRPPDGRTRQALRHPAEEVYHFPLLIYTDSYVSRRNLREDEQQLLEAQLTALQGNYTESIARCQSLLTKDISLAVRFGAYASIAYSSIPLGMHIECTDCLAEMERLRKQDAAHDEDYRLIHAFLRVQLTFNVSELESIRPEKLSSDAMVPYACFVMQSLVLNPEHESPTALRVYSALCRNLEASGILPAAMAVHGILALLYGQAGDMEAHEAHVAAICRIGYEQGFLMLLSKYSSLSPGEYQKVLSAMDPSLAKKIDALRKQNQRSWRLAYNRMRGGQTLLEYTSEAGELLLLLSHGLTVKEIAICKRLSPKEVNTQIKALCESYGLASKAELTDYARQVFTATRDSAGE